MELSQDGVMLAGTFQFDGRPFPFLGYISEDRGIAGTVALPFGSVIIVRLTRVGDTFSGSFYTENRDAVGWLIQTRKYDVLTPLALASQSK